MGKRTTNTAKKASAKAAKIVPPPEVPSSPEEDHVSDNETKLYEPVAHDDLNEPAPGGTEDTTVVGKKTQTLTQRQEPPDVLAVDDEDEGSEDIPEQSEEIEAEHESTNEPITTKEEPSIKVTSDMPGAGMIVYGEIFLEDYDKLKRHFRNIPIKNCRSLEKLGNVKVEGLHGVVEIGPYAILKVHLFHLYYRNFPASACTPGVLQLLFACAKISKGHVDCTVSSRVKAVFDAMTSNNLYEIFAVLASLIFTPSHLDATEFQSIPQGDFPQDLDDRIDYAGADFKTIFNVAAAIYEEGVGQILPTPVYLDWDPTAELFLDHVKKGKCLVGQLSFNVESLNIDGGNTTHQVPETRKRVDSLALPSQGPTPEVQPSLNKNSQVFAQRAREMADFNRAIEELRKESAEQKSQIKTLQTVVAHLQKRCDNLNDGIVDVDDRLSKELLTRKQEINKTLLSMNQAVQAPQATLSLLPPPSQSKPSLARKLLESRASLQHKTLSIRGENSEAGKRVADVGEDAASKRVKLEKSVSSPYQTMENQRDHLIKLLQGGDHTNLQLALPLIQEQLIMDGKTSLAEKLTVTKLKDVGQRTLISRILKSQRQ